MMPVRSACNQGATLCLILGLAGCGPTGNPGPPTLRWYVFKEPSGSFAEAARRCSAESQGRYAIELADLPADADQQREQLVRRLAAGDADIDLIGMDVIWTAELAQAHWIRPWPEALARQVAEGRIAGPLASATYQGRLWAAPFTTNTQLLWYRADRVPEPPATWDALTNQAEAFGPGGRFQVQGERYEGLTVFFVSLLASAGGAVLDPSGQQVSLEQEPAHRTLALMKRLANSPAADPALATSREDHTRLAFESGSSAFMVNYTYVWPSAWANAPAIAKRMGWARWPAVDSGRPSHVTIGGINLGVAAHSRHPNLAFEAAACIASEDNQRAAARLGGLPPTTAALYDDPEVRRTFPVAGFIGTPAMNFLPARLDADRLVLPMAELRLGAAQRARIGCGDGPLVAGIRPEHLVAAPPDGATSAAVFEGAVELVEWLGAEVFVHLDAGPQSLPLPPALSAAAAGLRPDRVRLIARLSPAEPVTEGARLPLAIDHGTLHLFHPDTGHRLGGAPDLVVA